jgi:hypothetical protein
MAMQGGYDPISGRSAMPTTKGGGRYDYKTMLNKQIRKTWG